MEKITENQKKTDLKTQSNKFEQSRQAAFACIECFPQAGILYRGQSKASKLPWKNPEHHLTKEQISQKPPGLFAVKLSTIALCALDFDRKSEDHKDGGDPKTLNQIWIEWELENYPWTQKTKNGQHAFFKKPPAGLKSETNKAGKGIDYKEGDNLLMLYSPDPWTQDLNTLKTLPSQAIQIMESKNKATKQKEFLNGNTPPPGYGKTNTLLNSGFVKFKNASTPYQLGHKCFEIVEAYKTNPGKTSKEEAIGKLGKSLMDGLSENTKLMPLPEQVTTNPEFKPQERVTLYKIVPRGYWITLVAETGTGKTTLVCHIIAQELKKDSSKKAYIYTQESDWSDNIVPSFIAEGLSFEQVNSQVIFKEALEYQKEKAQVFFDINSLKEGDFVVIEPTPLITNNPNSSKEVPVAIKEYHDLAKAKGLFMFGLHHTTTGWSATTLKEQGKFAKEWISYPRHCLILKEKTDGECIMFISKSNIMKRIGAVEFKVSQIDIVAKGTELKKRPVIKHLECRPELSTKKILKTMFKHEDGVEKPKKMKESTAELRGRILKYIKDESQAPLFDFVLKAPMVDHCVKDGRFTKRQVDWAIRGLIKDDQIEIQSGPSNRSEYRIKGACV